MKRILALSLVLASSTAVSVEAQSVARLEADHERIELRAGESVPLVVRAFDDAGQVVNAPLRIGGARGGISIDRGMVTGITAGEYQIFVSSVPEEGGQPVMLQIPIIVSWPSVTEVSVDGGSGRLIVGSRTSPGVEAAHGDGTARPYPSVTWASSDPSVADVDAFGHVRARSAGEVEITATVEGVSGSTRYVVGESSVASIRLEGGADRVRTGDVQNFQAVLTDAAGAPIEDVEVTWSLGYEPDDSVAAPAGPGQIEAGRAVADVPGVFTATASAGGVSGEFSYRVVPRDAIRKVEIVGQGRESRVFTTDFWLWEGLDGRDYAMTGSKYGDGISMVWDVTDPTNIVKTDSIDVDARTTNDIKTSPDGRYGVISREGASNRRNGVVILDLADPAHPKIASTYDEGLTGGVHNMFATDTHLFALSGGDKYVILDMSDIYSPRYVSEYNHPNSRVHDVWVHDGLAYSAEWGTGVVVVDVGNGRYGGSVENPTFVTSFPLTTGSTHAIFPYYQESTGRFLLIVGDERVQRRGLAWEGSGPDHRQQYDPETGKGGYPRATSGYIQIVDFSDPMNPTQLARYEVSEYGTHNMWVEDDVLYQAYYEGGVRMVDISGDLMGNLFTQGREMAVFKAHDPVGYIPNSPGAWSVIPWKGNIFFSDINSGMWAVRMAPPSRPIS